MNSTNPYDTFTRSEVERLNKLEAIVQRGLDADLDLGNALAEIRDASLSRAAHQTSAAYLRDRWGIRRSPDDQLSQTAGTADPPPTDLRLSAPATGPAEGPLAPDRHGGPDSLTNVWEQAGHAFGDDDVTPRDIRVTVDRCDQPAEVKPEPRPNPRPPGESEAGKLLARLGRLLTRSSGRIADVAHHLETRGVELDDDAREELRDDGLALHEELATLRALFEPVDWDAEHGRLLADEIPPFQDDPDEEGDE
ncbi:MAG TPA: hypothetical protein VGI50_09475 [Solirubrobacteraceae bacterium]